MCTSLVQLWRACGVMPLEHEEDLKSGQILVYALPLNNGSKKAVWPFLSHDEQVRAASYGRELDGLRFSISRTLLRGLLGLYTGINPCNLVFLIGPRGRPRLVSDQAADLDFNLARRDDCCVIALGLGRHIGVDIESCRSSKLVEATMIMFEDEDRAAIERTEGLNRHKRLIETWTALEARAKAIGTGIGESISYNRMVTCKNFELGCEWIGCVAAEGHNWQMKLISERRLQEQIQLSCEVLFHKDLTSN